MIFVFKTRRAQTGLKNNPKWFLPKVFLNFRLKIVFIIVKILNLYIILSCTHLPLLSSNYPFHAIACTIMIEILKERKNERGRIKPGSVKMIFSESERSNRYTMTPYSIQFNYKCDSTKQIFGRWMGKSQLRKCLGFICLK